MKGVDMTRPHLSGWAAVLAAEARGEKQNMRVEPLSRVAAEAELCRRHRMEFERLLKRMGRVEACQTLVSRHAKEYGALVTAARERLRARTAVA